MSQEPARTKNHAPRMGTLRVHGHRLHQRRSAKSVNPVGMVTGVGATEADYPIVPSRPSSPIWNRGFKMSTSLHRMAIGLMAASTLAGWAAFAPAEATPFSFNFTFGGGTDQTYTPSGAGTLLSNATTVTQGNQTVLSVDDISGPPAGKVSDSIAFDALPLSVPVAASGATVNAITITWDNIYTFTSSSGTYERDSINDALNFEWLGTFTDSSGTLNTQAAELTETWSQAFPNIEPSVGGSFNSNPSLAVPEPDTLWIFAAALAGLGFVRWRARGGSSRII